MELTEAERAEIYKVLLSEPVSHFLSLSAYTVSISERAPIISLKELPNFAVAQCDERLSTYGGTYL